MPINVAASHISPATCPAVLPREVIQIQPMTLGASLSFLRWSGQIWTKRTSPQRHFTSNRDNTAVSHQASGYKNIHSCKPDRRVSCIVGNRQN